MKRASIIIGILSSALALTACSNSKTPEAAHKKQAGPAPAETPLSPLAPTAAQQKAAQELLSQQEAPAPLPPSGDESSPTPVVGSPTPALPIPEPGLLNPTPPDSLPDAPPINLRGIRTPVPAEEAASSNDNAAPAPNAVELRGLRSPSMPKTLPMDITGKQTTGSAQ